MLVDSFVHNTQTALLRLSQPGLLQQQQSGDWSETLEERDKGKTCSTRKGVEAGLPEWVKDKGWVVEKVRGRNYCV